MINEEFYHIHSLEDKSKVSNKYSEKWKVGEILSFGLSEKCKPNLLYERIFNPYINIEWNKTLIKKLCERKITNSNTRKEIQSEFFQNGLLFKYFEMTREIILEEVRKSLFPEKPSRLNGIWLMDKQNLKTWQLIIPKSELNQKLFLVKFTGTAHKADGRWITEHSLSIDKIYRNAHGYWSGMPKTKIGKPHVEFICKGHVEIVNELEFHQA